MYKGHGECCTQLPEVTALALGGPGELHIGGCSFLVKSFAPGYSDVLSAWAVCVAACTNVDSCHAGLPKKQAGYMFANLFPLDKVLSCIHLVYCYMQGCPSDLADMLALAENGMETLARFARLCSLKWVTAHLLDKAIWLQMAQLPALECLEVSAYDGHALSGAVEVAACPSLTRLHLAQAIMVTPLSQGHQFILVLTNKVSVQWWRKLTCPELPLYLL